MPRRALSFFCICLFCIGISALAKASSIPIVKVTTSLKLRVLHIPLQFLQPNDVERLIRAAADAKFNIVILAINGMVQLDTLSPVFDKAWKKEELLRVAKYADSLGIKVIPEVKLLTHQKLFFADHYPNLMFDSETYDPNNPKVYKTVLPLLDELIELLHPSAIHIGHDEVNGAYQSKSVLGRWKLMLPAKLFVKDVLIVHEHLKNFGVETWIWGDMLLEKNEFPIMDPSPLNGGIEDYGKKLRNQLPRDIVICDWHYVDQQASFPSLKSLKTEGFKVLGATYLNSNTIGNFSRYVSNNGGDGMIATLWIYPMRKDWNTALQIIKISGFAFNSENTDEK